MSCLDKFLDKFPVFLVAFLGKFGCMFSKTGTLAASGDGASALNREGESVVVGRERSFLTYTKSLIELFSMGKPLGMTAILTPFLSPPLIAKLRHCDYYIT